MRHQKLKTRLGRRSGQRKALMRNLASALIERESIKTTRVKAKALRGFTEKLITEAKDDTVAARRKISQTIPNKLVVRKLFTEIAPLYSKTSGGYLRIIPYDFRPGDGADMALIEFTQKTQGLLDRIEKKAKIKSDEEKGKPAEDKKTGKAKPQKAAPEKTAEKAPKPEEGTKPEPKKGIVHTKKDEKKQAKPFLSNVKKYFRRKQRDQ